MRVNEMFMSIQGEGPWTGRQCVFVRLAGCNLACDFCDSKYARYGIEVTVEEVVKAIERYKCPSKCVVITGGEPMIQENDVYELAKILTDKDYHIALETNGTRNVNTAWFKLVVVSPKSIDILDEWYSIAEDDPSVIIKWVIDPETIDSQMMYLRDHNYHGVWLMPMGTTPMEIVEGMMMIVEKMDEYGIDEIVCNRLHVMVGCK